MNRTTKFTTIASAGLLSCAMIALAQDPPANPSTNPPPKPRQPAPPTPPRQPSVQPPAHMPDAAAQVGYMETPRYAQRLEGAVANNTILVFADKTFGGVQSTLGDVTKSHQAGTLNEYADKFDNDASSLRWNLAPGLRQRRFALELVRRRRRR
jgi:hypothetical protein